MLLSSIFNSFLTVLSTTQHAINDHVINNIVSGPFHPDAYRNVTQIITSRKFIPEEHKVVTADGYILTAQRIINPFIGSRHKRHLKPVLLMHGLFNSGIDFIINSPGGNACNGFDYVSKRIVNNCRDESRNNNIGFVLSNLGYDVWLLNARGSTYSREHSLGSDKLWTFSFDEMISYDLPAFIGYIQNKTKKSELSYVGFSQGTTIMFGLLSEKPKYSTIIKPFIALSPVTYVNNIPLPMRAIAKLPHVDQLLQAPNEILPTTGLPQMAGQYVCRYFMEQMCKNMVFLASNFDLHQLNATRLPVYAAHSPAGTSTWNILHWMQMAQSGKFQKFDYGKRNNLNIYGRSRPPIYRLESINSTDIFIMYSVGDSIAGVEDVYTMKRKLRVGLKGEHVMSDAKWNHADFLWGEQAGKYVNLKIVEILEQYV